MLGLTAEILLVDTTFTGSTWHVEAISKISILGKLGLFSCSVAFSTPTYALTAKINFSGCKSSNVPFSNPCLNILKIICSIAKLRFEYPITRIICTKASIRFAFVSSQYPFLEEELVLFLKNKTSTTSCNFFTVEFNDSGNLYK